MHAAIDRDDAANYSLGVDRSRRIIVASWIGIVGNALLAILKVFAGFLASSAAVLSDGVDSALDVLTSVITLIAARVMDKPPDFDHPYGHTRAETIATRTLSLVIFAAGAQLGFHAVRTIITGAAVSVLTPLALWITAISILGKTVLAVYKYLEGRATRSSMLVADAKNMRADIVISVTVLLGLVLKSTLDLPVIDSFVALGVSAWILWVAFGIFTETNAEMMEGHEDPATYQRIFDAVAEVPGAEHPHRTRIRTLGDMCIVDLDIEVDGSLTVLDAHRIAEETERRIKSSVPNVYDVLVHVEPLGNIELSERYGVSQRKLDDHLG